MPTVQLTISLLAPSIAYHTRASLKERPGTRAAAVIRDVGKRLDKHFCHCADLIDKLERDGWKLRHYAHFSNAQHPDVQEKSEAEFRLKAIGINPKDVSIVNTWDEWDEAAAKIKPIDMTGDEIMEALGCA